MQTGLGEWDSPAKTLFVQTPQRVGRHYYFKFSIEREERLQQVLFIPKKTPSFDPPPWIIRWNENIVDVN
jgi:hypothetical protein